MKSGNPVSEEQQTLTKTALSDSYYVSEELKRVAVDRYIFESENVGKRNPGALIMEFISDLSAQVKKGVQIVLSDIDIEVRDSHETLYWNSHACCKGAEESLVRVLLKEQGIHTGETEPLESDIEISAYKLRQMRLPVYTMTKEGETIDLGQIMGQYLVLDKGEEYGLQKFLITEGSWKGMLCSVSEKYTQEELEEGEFYEPGAARVARPIRPGVVGSIYDRLRGENTCDEIEKLLQLFS